MVIPAVRAEWGECCVCGQVGWLYSVNKITVKPRCFMCWRDAMNSGLISESLYRKIREQAKDRE